MKQPLTEIKRMQELAGINNKKLISEALTNDDIIYNRLLDTDHEQLVSAMLAAAEKNSELKLEDFLNEYGYDEEEG